MPESIRLGFIGAGTNTRQKHLPAFQRIPGVTLQGVCNQRAESTATIARGFGIPQTYSRWQDLINDPTIDAVVIGTWPHLHCEITCAALDAGKHVLTEARMASDLAEARQMLAAARNHPELTAMVVPSPFGLVYNTYLKSILDHGFIGQLREVVVVGATDQFWDSSLFLHPRQSREMSGLNTLALGILHETVSRWIPATEQVFAQSAIFEPERPVEDVPERAQVTVPDSVQVITKIAGGARGLYHLSGITLFGPGLQIHLYGSEGTIKVHFDPKRDQAEQVWTGRHGDSGLSELRLPADRLGGWRVEEEFIAGIRDGVPVTLNDFATAANDMAFTEAVHRSASTNLPVTLPLE